ncbi:unnamed protein product [Parnassius mnemosyne]|uniref:Uncharacterized protein n=1 Tax=Parnassius mnemosyne TaxID=213953 RepID=A0AAV1K6R9_9NEOP
MQLQLSSSSSTTRTTTVVLCPPLKMSFQECASHPMENLAILNKCDKRPQINIIITYQPFGKLNRRLAAAFFW